MNCFDQRMPWRRNLYVLFHYVLSRRCRKPFLASYKLTYRCNLRCQQCPFVGLNQPDPSFDQVKDTLDRLYARGSRIVIFEGGEPTLWRDGEHTFADVLIYARRKFFCTGVTTNGTGGLNLPVDVLWVSLDGMSETHNRLRGGNVFERVLSNIRESCHPRLLAHITVNSQNHREVPELIRHLRGLTRGVTIQFYYPYHKKDELFLEFEPRGRLLDEIIALKRAGYPVMNSQAALMALKNNRWHCNDWLLDNANPDGNLSQGCYLKGRDDIDCACCGFSPHTEISLAYQGRLPAILAGLRIFFWD